MKLHNSLSSLVVQIIELNSSLEAGKKSHHETYNVIVKENRHTEEAWENLQLKEKTHVETLKAHKYEAVSLNERF